MTYGWHGRAASVHSQPFSFPDELWLVCKARRLDFDWLEKFDGYIVSDRFMEAVQDHTDLFKIARVNVVDNAGADISARPMYFMKFRKIVYGVDMERSVWFQSVLSGQPLVSQKDGSPVVAAFKEIVLREEISAYDIVELCDSIGAKLLISDRIRKRLMNDRLTGMSFIRPSEYYVHFARMLNIDAIGKNSLAGRDTYAV